MSFSTQTTGIYRLLMGSILVLLLAIGMVFTIGMPRAVTNEHTTAASSGTVTSTVYPLSFTANRDGPAHAPSDPGCSGANANSAICQNSSGGSG